MITKKFSPSVINLYNNETVSKRYCLAFFLLYDSVQLIVLKGPRFREGVCRHIAKYSVFSLIFTRELCASFNIFKHYLYTKCKSVVAILLNWRNEIFKMCVALWWYNSCMYDLFLSIQPGLVRAVTKCDSRLLMKFKNLWCNVQAICKVLVHKPKNSARPQFFFCVYFASVEFTTSSALIFAVCSSYYLMLDFNHHFREAIRGVKAK